MSIKFPGGSVASAAPWEFNGSSDQFIVIDDPIALCHTPEPAVWKATTGPAKSVSLTATVTVLVVAVRLMIDKDEVLRVSTPGLAGVHVDV